MNSMIGATAKNTFVKELKYIRKFLREGFNFEGRTVLRHSIK